MYHEQSNDVNTLHVHTDVDNCAPFKRRLLIFVSKRSTHAKAYTVTVVGFLVVSFMSCIMGTFGRPNSLSNSPQRQSINRAVGYLAKFGYLTGPSQETGNFIKSDDLLKSIKSLQAMAGLRETGILDEKTLELMVKPRCGNSDKPDIVVPNHLRHRQARLSYYHSRKTRLKRALSLHVWRKRSLTFRILNYSPDMPFHMSRSVIRDAFLMWSNHTPLQFLEVKDGDADILIQFASRFHHDGSPFDGKGGVLAHAFYPGDGRGGDTHFDDDETWTVNGTEGTIDLFTVAVHEFGHALGLVHSSELRSIMYPWYLHLPDRKALPIYDIRSIQGVYGASSGNVKFHEPSVALIPKVHRPTSNNDDEDHNNDVWNTDDASPDPCNSRFDAISVIRQEVFFFIGKWFWRLDSRGILKKPVHIHTFWYNLPRNLTRINAVLEKPTDKKIIFFSGDRYWEFNANNMVRGFPREGRPIIDFGIPSSIKHIDAAFTWGYNKRTYIVSGDMYWRFDENATMVEYDYPRDMKIWKGVPLPVDAAMLYWDGNSYFFREKHYYQFYDNEMRILHSKPRSIADDWLHCSSKPEGLVKRVNINSQSDAMQRIRSTSVMWILICMIFLVHTNPSLLYQWTCPSMK